jgi:beta-ketoacyl-acyl-carrier-protein synthase II
MKQRVFITGMGVICSIGNDFKELVYSLKEGKSGRNELTAFDTEGLRSIYGCEIKDFNPSDHFSAKDLQRMDRASQLCLVAVREAVTMSKLDISGLNKEKCAVSFGSTLGGMISGMEYYRQLKKNKIDASRLLDYPLYSAGTRVCIEYGFLGPNIVMSTACSSSNVAIGYAYDLIQNGIADIVIAGGFDTMAEITCSGFGVLRNVSPDICRPFDKKRNGLILGEGAACLVLENSEHCLKREGKIYAELMGCGMSSDAYHLTAPDITGRGPALCMQKALEHSGVDVDSVDYINAHGTGTTHNDKAETLAIKKIFGKRAYDIPVSSTKSMHGHTLGAAGAVEAVVALAAIQHNFIPPTINYKTPDPKCDLDYVAIISRNQTINTVLSNGFGFGGNNCSIVIRRYNEK